MNTEEIYGKAAKTRNCLKHLKTGNCDARRRNPERSSDPVMDGDPFRRDKVKIMASKAIRRMSKKTQVISFSKI